MQKYINYLLTDLAEIAANPPEPRKYFGDGADGSDKLSNLNWETNHSPKEKMSVIFGIEKIAFPPAERLSETQLEQVASAFIGVWAAFNFEAEFPYYANNWDKYLFFVKYLDYETRYITNAANLTVIKVCRRDRNRCPDDGDYCNCQREMLRRRDNPIDLDDLDLDDLDLDGLDLDFGEEDLDLNLDLNVDDLDIDWDNLDLGDID